MQDVKRYKLEVNLQIYDYQSDTNGFNASNDTAVINIVAFRDTNIYSPQNSLSIDAKVLMSCYKELPSTCHNV